MNLTPTQLAKFQAHARKLLADRVWFQRATPEARAWAIRWGA